MHFKVYSWDPVTIRYWRKGKCRRNALQLLVNGTVDAWFTVTGSIAALLHGLPAKAGKIAENSAQCGSHWRKVNGEVLLAPR
jgi:hypothetical protein